MILLAAGNGGLQIYRNGSLNRGEGNFLVRTRAMFVQRGLVAGTGRPLPTVVRLLQTLIAAGYVHRDEKARGYHVTSSS